MKSGVKTVRARAKKALRAMAALAMVMVLLLGAQIGPFRWDGLVQRVHAANYWDSWNPISNSTTGLELTSGKNYRVPANSTVRISNSNAGGSGLTITGTVNIYIPTGSSLIATGAAGGTNSGGGAGIHLASGAILRVRGGGALQATGGKGGPASAGSPGGSAFFNNPNPYGLAEQIGDASGDGRGGGGAGGAGGRGAGGGGAGIGTPGSSGGAGGTQTAGFETTGDVSIEGGNPGKTGTSSVASGAAGALYVLDSVTVSAAAGSGGDAGGAGASNGAIINDQGSGYALYNHYWGRGGGGGGGGAGGAGASIGSGGSGGGGGGSGGSGGHHTDDNNWSVAAHYPNGGGGAGGTSGGTAGNGTQQQSGGSGGATGRRAAAGNGGTVYQLGSNEIKINNTSGTGNGLAAAINTSLASWTISYNKGASPADTYESMGSVPTSQKKYQGITEYITSLEPTRRGYSFKGWNTSSGATTGLSTYAANAAYNTNGNVTLYAAWSANKYELTLDNQSATTPGTSKIYLRYDTGYYIDSTESTGLTSSTFSPPSRSGYIFGGYYTGQAGSGTQIIASSGGLASGVTSRALYADSTLYAKWTPITYTLELYNNFSERDNSTFFTGSQTYGQTYTWPTPAFDQSRPGYSFTGWATDRSGSELKPGGSNYSNLTDTQGETVSRYAMWDITQTSITYDVNGGTAVPGFPQDSIGENGGVGGDYDNVYTYDYTQVRLPAAPTHDDYYFTGWEVVTAGYGITGFTTEGRVYQSAEVVPVVNAYGAVTLKAKWITLEGIEVEARDNPLVIPAGTFEAPSFSETATVNLYLNGEPSRVGKVELFTNGDTPQRAYSLAGTDGVYSFTRTYTSDSDTREFKIYVDGVDTGLATRFGSAENVYYYNATITTMLDGEASNYTSLELHRDGEAAIVMQRTAVGIYNYTAQVKAINGDDAKEYKICVSGEDSGQSLSFASGCNTATLERYTATVLVQVNDSPTNKGSISLVNGNSALTLNQTAAGRYTLVGWADTETEYSVYLNDDDTGETVWFAPDKNAVELAYYNITVTTTLDGTPHAIGEMSLKCENVSLPLIQTGVGVFRSGDELAQADAEYSIMLDGEDTGAEPVRFASSANSAKLDFFTVTYENNAQVGDTVSGQVTDSACYLAGKPVTVKNASPLSSAQEKLFLNWNTEQDGSGLDYLPVSGSFAIVQPTVLYAQWGDVAAAELGAEARWFVSGETNAAGEPVVHYGSLQEALNASQNNNAPVSIVVINSCELISDAALKAGDSLAVNQQNISDSGSLAVAIKPGVTLTNNGTISNAGTIKIDKGLFGTGALVNNSTLANAGTISGDGSLANSGTLDNTSGSLAVNAVDNTDGTLTGGTIENNAMVQGGTLAGSITQNGTVKDATVANGAILEAAKNEKATYVGEITNNGALLGDIVVGTGAGDDAGIIANSSTGRVGNTHPDSVVDNTYGTIYGGTIGGPYVAPDLTTVMGGTIGKSGESTFIDENARLENNDKLEGDNKNEGTIVNPGEIDGQLENNGKIIVKDGHETDITGDVTNGDKGSITIEDGGRVIIEDGGKLDNDGKIVIEGDAGEGGGQLIVEDGGKLENDNTIENEGIIKGDGEIDNNGLIDNDPNSNGPTGPTGTIGGPSIIDNAPSGVIDGGTIADGTTIGGGTITGDVTNEGTIDGSTIDENGTVTGGDFTGDVTNEGTIKNPDTIGPGSLDNNGEIVIDDGHKTVVDEDGKIINDGVIDNNGELENNGEIENNGTIDNSDGKITSDPDNGGPGSIDNNGTIENGDADGDGNGGLLDGQIIDNTDGIIDNGDPDGEGPGKGGGTIGGGTVVEGGIITLPVVNDGIIDGGTFSPLPNEEDNPDDPKFHPDSGSTGKIKYHVYFDMGGHGVQLPHASVLAGENVPVPNKPMETGWIFGGWFDKYDLVKPWNFTTGSVDANMTLYAKWTQCNHAGSTAKPTCTKNATCSLCKAKLNAHGHSFGPWVTAADGKTETRTCSICGITESKGIDEDSTLPTDPPDPIVPSKPDKPDDNSGNPDDSKSPGNEDLPSDTVSKPGDDGGAPHQGGELAPVPTSETTEYSLGAGSIILIITQTDGNESIVTVKDTEALVRAALPAEVLERVKNGRTVEIELTVLHIYAEVPEEDMALLESAREDYAQAVEDLQIGAYLDISLRYRFGSEAWVPIHQAAEDMELIIDIYAELLNEIATYFMLRVHEGVVVLLNDLDDEASTITIKSKLFSTYALAYTLGDVTDKDIQEIEAINRRNEGRCWLCGFCPHPLGICIFIWLLITIAIIGGIIAYRKKRKSVAANENLTKLTENDE